MLACKVQCHTHTHTHTPKQTDLLEGTQGSQVRRSGGVTHTNLQTHTHTHPITHTHTHMIKRLFFQRTCYRQFDALSPASTLSDARHSCLHEGVPSNRYFQPPDTYTAPVHKAVEGSPWDASCVLREGGVTSEDGSGPGWCRYRPGARASLTGA